MSTGVSQVQPPPDPDFRGIKSAKAWAKKLLAYVVTTHISAVKNGTLRPIPGSGTIMNLPPGSDLPAYPEDDGTWVLGVVIVDGTPSLQWFETDTCS